MKTLSILGSTGTIGRQVLEVVSAFPGEFQVAALAAGKNIQLLKEQMEIFAPSLVAVIDEKQAHALRAMWAAPPIDILSGTSGYQAVATFPDADLVVAAMMGAAGLVPTWEAIHAGKDIALANKETLVVAGELIMAEVKRSGVRLLPIDSEHSAVFQCIAGDGITNVKRIVLTASGGPFLSVPKEHLPDVSPAEALRHPNWRMGKKITVDSATMMNKALEVIEARWLFSLPPERIDVVIHPQSLVHSMVEFIDGSCLAQMSIPDMRIPISYALFYPRRMAGIGQGLDLLSLGTVTFSPPDEEKFPCLGLAREVLKVGGVMPAVVNAANEIAVDGFLAGRIRFTDIYRVVAEVMGAFPLPKESLSLELLLQVDGEARRMAEEWIEKQGYRG